MPRAVERLAEFLYRNPYEQYKVHLPEGECGEWELAKFTMDPSNPVQFLMTVLEGRKIPYGRYTCLRRKGERHAWMNDTPPEIEEHLEAIERIEAIERDGKVLITGLGIGMLLKVALNNPNVRQVDVVEIDEHVIRLVGKHYIDPRLTIHHADAFFWEPPTKTRYDVAWHDIWPTIHENNLPEMEALERKYWRHAKWQGHWAKDKCEF